MDRCDDGAVCGESFIEPTSLYSRSFALFWFFPLPKGATEPRAVDRFFANNVGFRRDVFLGYRFPDSDRFRGQCVSLADRFRKDGRPILLMPDAGIGHPPPNGLPHFVKRALCQGHDRQREIAERSGLRQAVWALGKLGADLGFSGGRIFRYHRAVGLSPALVPAALGIAIAYYGVCFLGTLVAMVAPAMIRRHAAV